MMRPVVLMTAVAAFAGLAIGDVPAAPLFPTPIQDVGWRPQSAVAADLDFDGNLDLLVANTDSNDLSILRGDGAGTLLPETRVPAGERPVLLLEGRFNGDALPDFAVFGSSTNGYPNVRVVPGAADGTVEPGSPTALAGSVYYAAAGDFNGDGLDDLVTADSTFPTGFARVYINQGNGTFTGPSSFVTASNPNSAAAGDFDEDGRADIIIGAYGQIAFHRNLGGGAFGAPVTRAVGDSNRGIYAADLNGDGHLDLAVMNASSSPPPGQPRFYVSVHLGDGHGGFSLLGPQASVAEIQRLTSSDLDGDGIPDLILGELDWINSNRGGVEFMEGHGDGTFATGVWYGAGSGVVSVAAGDFDHDGHPDVAAAILGAATNMNLVRRDGAAVFVNRGDGTFDQPRYGSMPFAPTARVDLDGDGDDDLVGLVGPAGVTVLSGQGDGSFDAGPTYPAGPYPNSVAVADLNGDGLPDIAVANGYVANVVTVLLNLGGGVLGSPQSYPGGEGHEGIAVADITHDGAIDIIVTNDNTNISVLPNLGNGTFGTHSRYELSARARALSVADLNDDGLPDVIAVGEVLMGRADGQLAPRVPFSFPPPAGMSPSSGVLLDVDGDGEEDLVLIDQFNYTMAVERGMHGGGFALPVEVFPTCVRAIFPVAADFDGDGLRDLAVRCESRDVAVHRGAPGGRFLAQERYAADAPVSLIAGDFDGNGFADLAYGSARATTGVLLSQARPVGAPPVANAGQDATGECASPLGGPVALDGTASSDPDSTPGTNDDIVLYEWFEGYGTPGQTFLGTGATLSPTLALGSHAITLRVTDSGGRISIDDMGATVVDTTPPVISAAALPALLWPPNHRLVPVQAEVTAADSCGPVTVMLLSVASSEPDDAPGAGDGATTGDIQDASPGTFDTTLALRAERDSHGSGRTYMATYSAQDAQGNVRNASATVVVPLTRNGTSEPLILRMYEDASGAFLSWDAVPGASGYSVIRGPLARLRGDSGAGPVLCVASGLTGTTDAGFEDASIPAPGSAFVYFVQYYDPEPSGYGTEPSPQDLSIPFPSDTCP
ncbi:MAG TPA: FG-GAP-like repeat-containing protein [Verrucomicrobiae bacterium]|nr:FG-GAP-like repeat-containing protein [Verrucomicrobiae bacterium]